MFKVKTPRDAKGPQDLKILRKTTASVSAGKMPARSARNMKHSHALKGARQITRIDRHPWEMRVAEILHVLEERRYGKANAMSNAVNEAEQAKQLAMRKMAEVETYAEEMQASNEEMRATNEEMKVVTEEMERVHMDLERFVPGAEQDMLRPLRSMVADVSTLDEKYGGDMTTEDKQKLIQISRKASRIEKMMEGVLEYWQVGITPSLFGTADCEQIVEAALKAHEVEIKRSNCRVTYDPMPVILADKKQLSTLFGIFIQNSINFAGSSSPKLHVTVQNIGKMHITIPESDISTGWLFSFTDHGIGIDPELQGQLFHFFGRGEEQGDGSGPGMGLAIAWKIVRRHGGKIWVESEPGRGSTFYFTIPE